MRVCVPGVCRTCSSGYGLTLFQVFLTEVYVSDAVRASLSPAVLEAGIHPSAERLHSCLYICLLAGRLPIDALDRLSVCRPHLLVCPALFQPVCVSDFSSLEISRLASSLRPSVAPPPPLFLFFVPLCPRQLSAVGLPQSGASHAHSQAPSHKKQANKTFLVGSL